MSLVSKKEDQRRSHVFAPRSICGQQSKPPASEHLQRDVKLEPKAEKSNAASTRTAHSRRSAAASVVRLELELEAAEAQAKIDKELIKKRLELSFARVAADVGCCDSCVPSQGPSRHTESLASERIRNKVEKWMEFEADELPPPPSDIPVSTAQLPAAPATHAGALPALVGHAGIQPAPAAYAGTQPAPAAYAGIQPAPAAYAGTQPAPAAYAGTMSAPAAYAGTQPAPAAYTGTQPAPAAYAGTMTAPAAYACNQPAPDAYAGTLPAPAAYAGTLSSYAAYAGTQPAPEAAAAAVPSNNTAERLLSRLATPRDLPTFDGDCVEWLHFKSAYLESTNVCRYTDSENLWRLRKALRGDAKEAVTDLLIGKTSPVDVMEALELRFGRSELIVQKIAAQLRKLNPLPSSYQNELFNFSVKINNSVATIRALHQDDYLRSPELVSAVVSKLPSTLLSSWTDFAYTNLTTRPKLELLADFLKREAKKLATIGVSMSCTAETKKPTDISVKRPTDEDKARQRMVFATTTVEQTDKCKFCKTESSHILPECRAFKRAMRRDRWRFAKAQMLCFRCLTCHDRSECTAPVCDIDKCGLPHHKLLHWKKPSSDDEESKSESEKSTDSAVSMVAHVSSDTANSERSSDVPTPDVILKVVSVRLRGPKGEVETYALLDDGASVSMIDSELANTLGLKCSSASDIKLVDAFGIEVFQKAAPSVSAQIIGQDTNMNSDVYDINLCKVSQLKLPAQNLSIINKIDCDHLTQIKDGVCRELVSPRLLIGEDNYFLIAPLEMIHGSRSTPYATRCRLGWTIHGSCRSPRTHADQVSKQVLLTSVSTTTNNDESLDSVIKNSFCPESIGMSAEGKEDTAHLRAVQIIDEAASIRKEQVQWVTWLDELKKMRSLRIPRWYINAGYWSPRYIESLPTGFAYPTPGTVSDNHIVVRATHIEHIDTLSTVMAEVWTLVNSCPTTNVTVDPNKRCDDDGLCRPRWPYASVDVRTRTGLLRRLPT